MPCLATFIVHYCYMYTYWWVCAGRSANDKRTWNKCLYDRTYRREPPHDCYSSHTWRVYRLECKRQSQGYHVWRRTIMRTSLCIHPTCILWWVCTGQSAKYERTFEEIFVSCPPASMNRWTLHTLIPAIAILQGTQEFKRWTHFEQPPMLSDVHSTLLLRVYYV